MLDLAVCTRIQQLTEESDDGIPITDVGSKVSVHTGKSGVPAYELWLRLPKSGSRQISSVNERTCIHEC